MSATSPNHATNMSPTQLSNHVGEIASLRRNDKNSPITNNQRLLTVRASIVVELDL